MSSNLVKKLIIVALVLLSAPAMACKYQGGLVGCDKDCAFDGGMMICTDPIPVPISDDHDEEMWSYDLCPYKNSNQLDTHREIYAHCIVKGGSWSCDANNACTCIGAGALFDPDFPGVSANWWALYFQGRPGIDTNVLCEIGSTQDSGWGQSLVHEGGSAPCWSVGPKSNSGIQIQDGREIINPDFKTLGYPAYSCSDPNTGTVKSWARKDRGVGCPTGYTARQTTSGETQCFMQVANSCPVGQQIELPEGFETHPETDITAPILFGRHFAARIWHPVTAIGSLNAGEQHWQHTYQRRLFWYPNGRTLALRNDHKRWLFNADDSLAVQIDGANPILKRQLTAGVVTGWTLLTPRNELEVYDATGRLIEIRGQSEMVLSMVYSDSSTPPNIAPVTGLLIRIVDERGRSIDLTYDANARLQTASVGTHAVTYGYDDDGILNSVIYPDQSARGFIYNESDHLDVYPSPTLQLTGIIDEAGNRVAHYFYDDQGRVKEEYGPTPQIDRRTMEYYNYSYLKVIETDPLGAQRERRYSYIAGAYRNTYNFDGCSSCGAPGRTSIGYTSDGRLQSLTDAKFKLTWITTDPLLGVDTERRDPLYNKVKTIWDPALRVRLQSDTLKSNTVKARRQWTYNSRGQVLTSSEIDPATNATRVTTRTYCESVDPAQGCPLIGLLRTVDGPRTDIGDVTNYEYHLSDAANCGVGSDCDYRAGDLYRVVNSASHITEYRRYDYAGRPLRIADANGNETHLSYDARGRLISRRVCGPGSPVYPCSGPDVAQMTISYTAWGGVETVTQADGSWIVYGYDTAHRLTSITDGLGNSIVYTLDPAGNRVAEQTFDTSQTLKRELTRQFNVLGQLQATLNAQSDATQYSYDINGNRETTTDPLGVVTDNDYDAINRLIKTVQDYGGAADINATTQYAYDERDNLIKVTDPKNLKTEYIYNGLNDQVTLISPDTGTTAYEYDSAGNRSAQVDARGVRTEYDYDVLNRLTQIRYPADGSKDVGFIYDQQFSSECPSGSVSIGRLSRFTDHSGQTTLCYDHRGNVTRKVQVTDGQPLVTAWTYDLANRVTGITYPSGKTVTIGRDTLGRVSSVSVNGATLPGGGSTLISAVTYEPFGPVKQISYGDGFSQTRSYDQNYWISQIDSSRGTGLDAHFEQDAVGNIVKLSGQAIGSGGGTGTDRAIGYDDLYRLTEVRDRNDALIEQFSYDDTGNRLSKASADSNAQATGSYAYPTNSHRLASVAGIGRSYDAVGNLTAIAEPVAPPSFDFDQRNRMVSQSVSGVTQVDFDYNGRGERVWRDAGVATLFAYDESGRLLGEYSASGALISEVIWLDDLPVGVIRGGTVYPVEADHLGSPRVVASGSDAIWRWDLFGAVFGDQAPNEDPDGDSSTFRFDLRFPGQQWDAASGLHYNYFRDYESGTGRYVESDPIGLLGGVSTFGYVGQSPTMWIDPEGLWRRCTLVPRPDSSLRDETGRYYGRYTAYEPHCYDFQPDPPPPPAQCEYGSCTCYQRCLSREPLAGIGSDPQRERNITVLTANSVGAGIGLSAAGSTVCGAVSFGAGVYLVAARIRCAAICPATSITYSDL